MKTRSITRLLSVSVCAIALNACGDDGGVTSTAGQTTGDTTESNATPPTTTDPDPTMGGTGTTIPDPSGTIGDSQTDTGETATTDATSTTGEETDTAVSATMVAPECGNGAMEGSEECDDGNQEPNDGCEPDCSKTPEAVCGNEVQEIGEACDDGNTEDGDECSADCQRATPTQVCGNGTVEAPEQCDDSNMDPGDGCEPDCTFTPAECGNGAIEGDEECDDGNNTNGGPNDFCKNDCTVFMPASCQAPAKANYINCDDGINLADKADKTNALKAIGICNDNEANSIVIDGFEFDASAQNASWQIAKGFGTYKFDHDMEPATPDQLLFSPREGSHFLMLSTGTIKAPNAQGIVTEVANSQQGNAENGNNDSDALPAPFKINVGSNNGAGGTPFQNCNNGAGDSDCSDTLQAQWTLGDNDPNDRIYFTFKTKVPAGTYGYTFDFVFCSSEWPTWVNDPYNDILIAYQVDPTADDPQADPPIDPYSGNVTFIPDPDDNTKGLPLTITALDPYYLGPGFSNLEPQLAGTGFEQHACSDWFTAKGGVQPGAEVTIGFYLADMGDSAWATVALLDNFRWDCEGCIPSEVVECGVTPPM